MYANVCKCKCLYVDGSPVGAQLYREAQPDSNEVFIKPIEDMLLSKDE